MGLTPGFPSSSITIAIIVLAKRTVVMRLRRVRARAVRWVAYAIAAGAALPDWSLDPRREGIVKGD
jgi:predicted cation transporter